MITCTYCGAEMDRLVFCKPSHKVLYHRKKGNSQGGSQKQNETPPKNIGKNQGEGDELLAQDQGVDSKLVWCKHGNRADLCNHYECRQT